MDIEAELKELILKKYKSLREFAIKIDMPYSTLDSIFKRGVQRANISNIIKICKELNIDTESLGEGKIVYKKEFDNAEKIHTIAAHHDGENWTEEELEDIENFKKYVLSKRENKK